MIVKRRRYSIANLIPRWIRAQQENILLHWDVSHNYWGQEGFFWDHVDSELFLSRSCLGNGEQQLSNITADKPCINGLSLKYSSSSQGSWFWKTRRWSLNIYEICRYYHYIRQIQGRGWLRTVIIPPQVRRKANQYINSVYLLYTPVEAKLRPRWPNG